MDFLLHNIVADMRGPQFLALYGSFIVLVWVFGHLSIARSEKSTEPAPTLPAAPDPFELAWLRDGERGVLHLAIFSLVQLELLLPVEGLAKFFQRNPQPNPDVQLNGVQRLLLNEAFPEPRNLDSVFRDFEPRLADHCAGYAHRAQAQELLTSAETQALRVRAATYACAAILLAGGYKLAIAFSRGRTNVVFLIVFCVIGLVVTRILCRKQRLSRRGRDYLKQVTSSLEFMKGRTGEDPSMAPLLVAVFGLGILYGTPLGDLLRVPSADAGASSGGDTSSSDSGSSDSGGGGDGGSGCGGCGGGGGD